MSTKVPTQAKSYGIEKPGVKILYAVTYWLNGNELEIRGEERRFSKHHDLRLEDLFRGIYFDYDEDAHERLLDKGLLEESYVARRKIDWAPTQQGRQAIRDIVSPISEIEPSWKYYTDRTGPLWGDPNESVTHRKAVLIAGRILPRIAWAYDISEPGTPSYGYEYYPSNRRGKFVHDFHLTTMERLPNVGVEVITNHTDIEQVIERWKQYQKTDRVTFWIFDRRETACKLWNALEERGEFLLVHGWFKSPSSWAAEAINHKIWRSSLMYRGKQAGDVVYTLTEILEGKDDAFHETFDDYLSYE